MAGGGDGKGLGIVLTPKHVTELLSLIGNVTKDDTVLDVCARTGGFLISAMVQMMRTATAEAEIAAAAATSPSPRELQPEGWPVGPWGQDHPPEVITGPLA